MISAEYMAGLFDGEGSVMISRPTPSTPTRYQLRVVLGMAHEETVRAFHTAAGCGFFTVEDRKKQEWKDCYRWTETGKAAGLFLERLRPYLITKAEAADIGIEFGARKRLSGGLSGKRGGVVLTAEELAIRKELADKLTAVNKRGR